MRKELPIGSEKAATRRRKSETKFQRRNKAECLHTYHTVPTVTNCFKARVYKLPRNTCRDPRKNETGRLKRQARM